jgi:hypothetical protein
MKPGNRPFLAVTFCLILFSACTKNDNPKTIYDTVTITKTDTLRLPPPNDTPNLTNGLVLYLPFTNGSMADSSGGGNTVTAVGGGGLGYDMHGYAQSAFNSNGNGQYLVVSNNGYYALDTAFSLSLDFMIRSTPSWNGVGVPGLMTLASLVNTANGNGPTFHIVMGPVSEPQNLYLAVQPSSNTCDNGGVVEPGNFDTTSFAPQIGAWYNLIITFSSGSLNLYVNGQSISSKNTGFNSLLFCNSANFVVGGWWNGDPESIDGEIDEVRMYNRSLSAVQIAWLARNFQIHSNAYEPGLQSGKAPMMQ